MYNQEGNYYKPTIVAQKIIDNQNCYLVTKKGESKWINLADANERKFAAIVNFERQRQHASEIPYNPLADRLERELDRQEQEELSKQGKINILGNCSGYKTKLRSNQLIAISKVQFYDKNSKKKRIPEPVINLDESDEKYKKCESGKDKKLEENLKREQKGAKLQYDGEKMVKGIESESEQKQIMEVGSQQAIAKIQQKHKMHKVMVRLKLYAEQDQNDSPPSIAP